MIRRVACFNGRIPVDRANSSAKLPCLQRSLVPTVDEEFDCRQEDRYTVAVYGDIRRAGLACTVLGHLPRKISSVSFTFLEHDGTITCGETGNLSRLASIRKKLFRLTKFRAL